MKFQKIKCKLTFEVTCLMNSKHCKMFRNDPNLYFVLLTTFLALCYKSEVRNAKVACCKELRS
jgi:hypothetical protein